MNEEPIVPFNTAQPGASTAPDPQSPRRPVRPPAHIGAGKLGSIVRQPDPGLPHETQPPPPRAAAVRSSRRILLFALGIVLLAAMGSGLRRHLVRRRQPPGVREGFNASSNDRYLKAQSLLLKSDRLSCVNAATQLFASLTQTDPQSALAWAGLGNAHFRQYQHSGDPKLLDLASTESSHALTLNEETAPAFVTLAHLAMVEGNHALALRMANQAIRLDPGSPDAFLAQGAVYETQGNAGAAQAAARRAVALAPDDWHASLGLGASLLSSGMLQEAEEQFKRSAALAPDNDNAYYELAVVDMRLNKRTEARANIERALQIDPNGPAAYRALAAVLHAEARSSTAAQGKQKPAAREPGNSRRQPALAVSP